MILVVDDKKENTFSLKRLLELNKYKIDTANSGEEALKKIRTNQYALLLLDVQMPGMDGFEVAQAISGYNKAKDLPIIFLSAVNLDKEFITKGYISGGIDYITKPFDPEILLLKVRNLYRLSEQKRQLDNLHEHLKEEVESVKRAEYKLNIRNQELLSLVEALPQIGFTANSNGQIESVNRLWYNYSEHKQQFPEVYPGDISIVEQWELFRLQEIRFESEVRIKELASDEYRYHLLIIVPVKKDNSTVKWVGTLTNITEQKTANQILEHRVKERTAELEETNRKLEISNDELEQFASVVSHDLKEPLRKIRTFSSFIKDRNLLTEGHGSDYIDRIIYSSQRMTQMIDNLLNYSTISAAELAKPIYLNSIIDEVLIELNDIIKEKGAILQIGELPQIEIIAIQIKQVFYNIIGNALKFSRKDVTPIITIGSETIEEKSANSNASASGKFCRITITDNGIGFDEKYASKIFMIFQKLNNKTDYEGHGIGLATVKRILNKHNGIICASSKINEGTKITIVLPFKLNTEQSIIDSQKNEETCTR